MFKFFREKESAHVKGIRAVRCEYLSPDVQEVAIEFVAETGERLTLQLTPRQAFALVHDLQSAYEAINPPLNRSQGYSQWGGME